MSSSLSVPVSPNDGAVRPEWSFALGAPPRGLVLAREKGALLVWDEDNWLYLLDGKGNRQAQVRAPGRVVAACAAEDGSAYVALGKRGEMWWLAPDLMSRGQLMLPDRGVAAALDTLGQYLLVADSRPSLQLMDCYGRLLFLVETARPLFRLAFAPNDPFFFGCADYGLVAAYNLAGECLWRDGLVAHVGSLAVAGSSGALILACYSEGLMRYGSDGGKLDRWVMADAARLASASFDGRFCAVATMKNRLQLLDNRGQLRASLGLRAPLCGLALAPLAERVYVAQSDGTVSSYDLREFTQAEVTPVDVP